MNTCDKRRFNPLVSILLAELIILPLASELWQMHSVPMLSLLGASDQIAPTNAVIWVFRENAYLEYDINNPANLKELAASLNRTQAHNSGKAEMTPAGHGVYRVYLLARTASVHENYAVFTLAGDGSGRVYLNERIYRITAKDEQALLRELERLTASL